jgi:hypothetical protein
MMPSSFAASVETPVLVGSGAIVGGAAMVGTTVGEAVTCGACGVICSSVESPASAPPGDTAVTRLPADCVGGGGSVSFPLLAQAAVSSAKINKTIQNLFTNYSSVQ